MDFAILNWRLDLQAILCNFGFETLGVVVEDMQILNRIIPRNM